MERSVVSKGKNVQEAVEQGLELLKAKREEVSIEILEEGKKGMLGWRAKSASVRLTRLTLENIQENIPSLSLSSSDPQSAQQTPHSIEISSHMSQDIPESMDSNEEGKVWIKNSEIEFKSSMNHCPTIVACPEVQLFKNGERIIETTLMIEHDKFELIIPEEIQETKWNVLFNSTKTEARLDIQPGLKKVYTVKDHPPVKYLKMAVTEEIIPFNDLNINEVMMKLQELGIKVGLQHQEIIKATETLERGIYVIAIGERPQPGENGRLELMVEVEKKKEGPKEREDGKIDFREIQSFPSLNKGELLGKVHPPRPGKPGLAVTGELIPPEPAHPLNIKAGKGVQFLEEQGMIFATEFGRPQIEGSGLTLKISVMPKLMIPQDVDLSSGNIRFIGDVEIGGHVVEEMKVEAEGIVMIRGSVSKAEITAGQSIEIRQNVIGSTLNAGKSSILLSELGELLRRIKDPMEALTSTVAQLLHAPGYQESIFAQKRFGEIVKIVVEKKFQSLLPIIKKLSEKVNKEKDKVDGEWIDISTQLVKDILFSHTGSLQNLQDLQRINQKIEALYEMNQSSSVQHSRITIPYALNSQLYCSGDVDIIGPGCYQTMIRAEGKVRINGSVRGGEILANQGAELTETGAKGSISTLISVPSDQSIRIQHVLEDTIIYVGNRKHTFYEPAYHVFARLDENGELRLY